MSTIRLRIPLQQYSYIEYDFEGTPEQAIREVEEKIALFNNPISKDNLEWIPFLRLLHRYMTTESLQMEDVDSLGTQKIYSQRDVVDMIRKVFDKIKRDK